MTTLVTGGTGFIGSRLALRCLAEGEAVRVTGRTRNPVEAEHARGLRERGAEVVEADLTDPSTAAELVAGVQHVHHLAAAQHEANVPDSHFRAVNVEGTRNLLDAAANAGVRRFVHGSTIGVYGWRAGTTVTETSSLEPDNIYGVTKLAGEEVVGSYASKLSTIVIRISETYGPGDRRLLKLFRGVQRGVFLRIGPGTNLHHLIFIDDLVRGLRRAAEAEGASGETLVLAGPRPVETREMVAAAARALGTRPPRLRIPLAPLMATAAVLESGLKPLGIQPPLHRRRMDFFRKSFSFSGDDARRLLDFQPRVELAEGMDSTARWYREEGLL